MPVLLPVRLFDRLEVGRVGGEGSSVDFAGWSRWKEEGSGEGRRLRIREAKDSLEARVLRSREVEVGGMRGGSWGDFGGVVVGGGVGGRGRKKGILRGEEVGEVGVLGGDADAVVLLL